MTIFVDDCSDFNADNLKQALESKDYKTRFHEKRKSIV